MNVQMRSALTTLVAGSLVILLAACGAGGVSGSGPTTTEARSVDTFTRVEVGDGIGLTVRLGEARSVEVLAQANILPVIATTVEGGTLKIRATQSFATNAGVSVAVSMPGLEGISISDGSQAEITGLASDDLDIAASGGARLTATGRATEVTLEASDGARADLAALAVETMNVVLSGGATANLNVSEQLTGTASGGAVATVAGGAALNVRASDGASVTSN